MERGWDREAAVAGKFYSGSPPSLLKELEDYLQNKEPDSKIIAVMAPHAGYKYSGKIAAEAYRRLVPPKRAIILAPNHTGQGSRISIWGKGVWRTPLGEAHVDEEGARWLLSQVQMGEGDREAHRNEHAIEVHLPFLQFLNPEIQILPIVLSPLSPEYCEKMGRLLAELVQEAGSLLIASTDMSHYIPAERAKVLDKMALDRVVQIDGPGLYNVVVQQEISMCGFIPTTCVLEALSALGGVEAELLKYGNSGEVTGDRDDVVGYASVAFRRQ